MSEHVIPTAMPAPLWGMMARFDTSDHLLEAAEKARDAGFTRLDAYSPYPVHGLSEAIGFHRTKLPLIVLLGGLTGGLIGYFGQLYLCTQLYPFNIGGRPLNSWPSFIPVTFELTVLFASFAAVFGMLGLNNLPEHYHPVFNVDSFGRASRDGFFLCIESRDPKFDRQETRRFLESLKAEDISEVVP